MVLRNPDVQSLTLGGHTPLTMQTNDGFQTTTLATGKGGLAEATRPVSRLAENRVAIHRDPRRDWRPKS